ncbi:MAG: HEAT repeat domain-containing protein [Planctomycetota bacterium]
MWIHAVTLAAASIGWAPVQDDADSIFQKAQVLESVQGDLASAARAYERVVMLSPDGDLAIRASYRLGLIWKQLGKEEAATAALERAATGEGELAVRAQEILDGAPIGSQDRLAKQVDELLEGVRGGLNGSIAEGFRIIGPEAVPFIVRSIDRSEDLLYIGRAASLMMMLGGPDAVQFFEKVAASEDAVMKRAVLASAELGTTKEVADVLRRFLRDEDESVAIRAFDLLRSPEQPGHLSIEESLRLVDRTRIDLADHVLSFLTTRAWVAPAELRSAYERLTRSPLRESTERALARVLGTQAFSSSRSAGELYLELLADPRAPGVEFWWRSDLDVPFQSAAAVVPLERILNAARSLAEADFDAAPQARRALEAYINSAHQFLFDDSSREVVFELVRLGYADAVDEWLSSHPSELTFDILKHTLDQLPDPTNFLNTLRAAEWHPRPEEVDAFVNWFESRADWPATRNPNTSLRFAAQACLLAGTERSTLAVVDFVAERTDYYAWAAENLIRQQSPASKKALQKMLVLPVADDEVSAAGRWRGQLFGICLRYGDEQSVDSFAKSYELGLDFYQGSSLSQRPLDLGPGLGSAPVVNSRLPRGLAWFAFVGEDGRPVSSYDTVAEREIVRRCLAIKGPSWTDAKWCFDQRTYNPRPERAVERLPLGLVLGVTDALLTSPPDGIDLEVLVNGILDDDRLEPQLRRQVVDWALTRHQDPRLVELALERLPDLFSPMEAAERVGPIVRNRPTGSLRVIYLACSAYLEATSHSAKAIDEVLEITRSLPETHLAREAARALADELPAATFIPLLETIMTMDGTYLVRFGIDYLRDHLRNNIDSNAIALLIRAYEHADEEVRQKAKNALDELRSYRETIGFWERVQRGTELTQESAAQALIEQARDESKSIEVRVTAIRSLGTLGLAESLPILIGWLDSDNEQIREAAKAAIEKINR